MGYLFLVLTASYFLSLRLCLPPLWRAKGSPSKNELVHSASPLKQWQKQPPHSFFLPSDEVYPRISSSMFAYSVL